LFVLNAGTLIGSV